MVPASANAEQISHWNEQAGPVWVENQQRLDRQLRAHGASLLDAAAVARDGRVLDAGCGCGDTTLEAARRVGDAGGATGIDVSQPMLARARERAAEAGLANARFEHADVQTAALPAAGFEAVVSRFGVMFFEDPVAAFVNLRRALVPGGRLAFVSWQGPAHNPWIALPMAAVAPLLELPPAPPEDAPGMFSLADPERVRRLLAAAGLADAALEPLALAMRPGAGSLDDAVDFYLRVGPISRLLREQQAGGELEARVRDTLHAALEREAAGGELALGSAAWLVTARRPL